MQSTKISKIAWFSREIWKREGSCERTTHGSRMAQSRENCTSFGFGNIHYVYIPRTGRDSRNLPIAHCARASLPVRSALAIELVRPQPQHHLPAMDRQGVEARRQAGDEGGVVGAHRGAGFTRGLGGVESIIPEVLHG